ncbi:MAG TPA: amidohydrolase [Sphingomicrobium sp.]|nr:amidohydrolase [Sphingomicrobium sp.]
MKLALIAGVAAMMLSTAATAATLRQSVEADMPLLMEVYRDLHANPELSFQEVRSAAKLAAEVRKLGFEVTEKIGKTGVVAVMKNGPGPVLTIRADMDALPVKEQTGLPFASTAVGTLPDGTEAPVMHACGHDTHMASWIGTARRLAAMKDQWSGTLVMILQPAEEIGRGAEAMLEDGLYTRFPKPDYVLAFHDKADLPAGIIGMAPGYALASVDSVDITVHGVGGHGAYPHTTRDPIVLGSQIVTALQTLVSRENDPQQPAVVTVGSFRSGSKHNIISDEAKLQLTVRSYTPETRKLLLDGIKRIARGQAIAAGLPEDKMPEVVVRESEFTPATFNTEKFSDRAMKLFTEHFGSDRVQTVPAVMGGEDFSRYRLADESIESLLFWVGGTPLDKWKAADGKAQNLPSLHSPFFAPDAEAVISTATEALTLAALDILKKG